MPNPTLHRCAFAYPATEGEVQLFPAGTFRTTDGRGPFTLTANLASKLIASFNALSNEIAIDYEHQLMFARANGQPAPAAGWITALRFVGGTGLFAKVRWTERASAAIKAGEYRYISPVFGTEKNGEIKPVMFPAALTNHPAIDGMADAYAASQTPNQPQAMEPNMDLLKKLAAMLGLPDTATEDEVMDKLKDKMSAAAPVAASVDHSQFVPVAAVQQLQAQLASLANSVQQTEVKSLVAASLASGKLPTALEPWALSQTPAALAQYLASAPVIPALNGMQTASANLPAQAQALNAGELEVCSRMGISPEAFIAAKPKA
jgi:phage I-like protein